jgi:ribosomal protein S18 acetylase RimI-like enzyme
MMGQEFSIRSAGPDEFAEIGRLVETHYREVAQYDPLGKLLKVFDAVELTKMQLDSGRNKFFVAEADGRLAGFVRLTINSGPGTVAFQKPRIRELSKRFSPLRPLRKILATLLGWVTPKTGAPQVFKDIKSGYIADLFVLPEHRKNKVGSALVNASLEWFKANGCETVFLQVLEANQTGMAFWEGQGFDGLRRAKYKKL